MLFELALLQVSANSTNNAESYILYSIDIEAFVVLNFIKMQNRA